MLRPKDLLVLTRQIDEPLGRDTAPIVGLRNVYLRAERRLCLFDGHAFGNADIDVDLLPCRIFYAQHLILPVGILILVHLQRPAYGLLYQLLIIHIDASHKGESLRDDILLCTMVVLKPRVVRAYVWQFVLQRLVAIADIGHHLSQPVFGEQAVHLLRSHRFRIASVVPSGVARVLCVHCYHIVHRLSTSGYS